MGSIPIDGTIFIVEDEFNKIYTGGGVNIPHNRDEIFDLINKEDLRQKSNINLIASENIASNDVMIAAGSVLTNKYAEGYPGGRYYGGCKFIDEIENITRERLKKLFDAQYVNVQPHSGASANIGVYFALLNPFDKIMGMNLSSGGHLTHGSKVSISGKWLTPIGYDVNKDTFLLDYDDIYNIAQKEKPRLIIAGGSAYPRTIDFKKFREIADSVGAYLMVDMAHFAGLVAAKKFDNPIYYADIVTSTTHKTLRGPRGGIILSNNLDIGKKIDKSIMPGVQGGPLMHIIAAKGIAFKEALSDDFNIYIDQVLKNTKALSNELIKLGFNVLTKGTDTHLMLIDIRNICENGHIAEAMLEEVGIICNKNSIPFDPNSALRPSGIRFGTPFMTSRGFKENHFIEVANIINDTLRNNKSKQDIENQIKNILDVK